MTTDPLSQFKAMQKAGWAHFAPLEAVTTSTAAKLVAFAGIRAGNRVLDVACGTGVVAVTAARLGARVTALDLSPDLLARARENSGLAGVEVDWHEGDAEALPFADGEFDRVVSQFGHMFAPRPDVTTAQMLRVLRPGGTIAFSTWPPELFVGRMFALTGRYAPPPPPGVSIPIEWGDVHLVAERLGPGVRDLVFDRASMLFPALSPQHYRTTMERTAGPLVNLVRMLAESDPVRLAAFRRDVEALVAEHLTDNVLRQDYLLSRAVKV